MRCPLLILLAATLLSSACVHSSAPTRLAQKTEIAIAYSVDATESKDVTDAPQGLRDSVARRLDARNLRPVVVDHVSLRDSFESHRSSTDRLAALAEGAPGAGYLLLVESRARFYSFLSGKYRWNVQTRVTVADRADPSRMVSDGWELGAFLDFEHEDGDAAIASLSEPIADRVGRVLDRFISARPAKTPAADTPSAAPVQEPQTGLFAHDDSVYFVMIDRFANGDKSNDGDADPTDPQGFHGGDLRGLIANLDHLQRLGVTTIWLSPIFDARDQKFHEHGAYHGYWTDDLAQIERRFGTREELAELRDELRRRDMKLLLDMVLNHVSFDAPLLKEKPGWFHGRGGIHDWNDPTQIVTHDVHGLPDLAQEKPEVASFLVQTSKQWIEEARPAGFRLDAVKHVSNAFWRTYNDAMREAGGEDFVLLAELLDGNPIAIVESFTKAGFNAAFDFPFHFALVDVFCRNHAPARLASVLYADRLYPLSVREDRSRLVTLLDNHDLPRVASICGNDKSVANAFAFMAASRGTPSLTWGTEAGLNGAKEPENRADMQFGTRHPTGAAVQSWLTLRAAHPSLSLGLDELIALDATGIAYLRASGAEAALIAYNAGGHPRTFELPADLAGMKNVGIAGGRLADDGLVVGPNTVAAAFFEVSPQLARSIARRTADPARVSVPFSVAAELPTGSTVFVVGSGPEIGNWSANEGQKLVRDDGQWTGAIALPTNGVFAFKFVAQLPDGTQRWEGGENRYVHIKAGASISSRWQD